MRRVPLLVVILLIPLTIGVTWWLGVRHYDFLKAPTATEIESARARASQNLAQPSDLFAVDHVIEDALVGHEPPVPTPPQKPRAPRIDPIRAAGEAPISAWAEYKGLPAASFIELASVLEAEPNLPWARAAWERVLDSSARNGEEIEIAIKGIRRTRAQPEPDAAPAEDAPKLILRISAPDDRTELTRRAAEMSATALHQATDRLLNFKPEVSANKEDSSLLVVRLGSEAAQDNQTSVSVEAPADVDGLRDAILRACFKLVASALAAGDRELQPIPSPGADETPSDSLANRITRLAWREYGRSMATE